MWNDLKSIFGREEPARTPLRRNPDAVRQDAWPVGYPSEESSRHSRALEQFLQGIRHDRPMTIIDMGGANQANVNYITNLGHKIGSENLLPVLDSLANTPSISESRKIEEFLDQTLKYQESSVGGVLMWESLQYMPQPFLEAAIKRLYYLLEPGSMIFALLHADERAVNVANYAYRIVDQKTLQLSPRGLRKRVQPLNNRSLENFFQSYRSVKFFLTRDNFREVLVTR